MSAIPLHLGSISQPFGNSDLPANSLSPIVRTRRLIKHRDMRRHGHQEHMHATSCACSHFPTHFDAQQLEVTASAIHRV